MKGALDAYFGVCDAPGIGFCPLGNPPFGLFKVFFFGGGVPSLPKPYFAIKSIVSVYSIFTIYILQLHMYIIYTYLYLYLYLYLYVYLYIYIYVYILHTYYSAKIGICLRWLIMLIYTYIYIFIYIL